MSSIFKGLTLNEGIDFAALQAEGKKKIDAINSNPELYSKKYGIPLDHKHFVGAVLVAMDREEQRANQLKRDTERKAQYEKSRSEQLAKDTQNIDQLKNELALLQKDFDPSYEYSDDYTFWNKQKDIASKISSLKKRISDVEGQQLDELSPQTLASYKKKAGADATASDKRGDYKRGDKRMSGIMKATRKEFDNDSKGVAEGWGKTIKRLATGKDVKSRAGQEIAKSQDANMKGDNKTANKHFKRYDKLDKLANKEQGVAEGSLNEFAPDGFNGGDDSDEFSPEMAKMAQDDGFTKGASLADGATTERAMKIQHWDQHDGGMYKQYFAKGFKQGRLDKIRHNNKQYNLNLKLMKDGSIRHGEQGVAEEKQRLDPKCWKGYKKQGTKMKGDTRVNNCVPVKESAIMSGLNQIDEGWKEKLGAAALAGSMALGAGAAHSRVTPDGQGGFTGGLKPSPTVTAPTDNKPAAEAPSGFNKEYLQKAANPDRVGRFLISVEKAQELLKNMP